MGDENRILSKEKEKHGHAGSGNAIGERATTSKEAQCDGVTGEPIDGDPEDAATLAHTWIHGGKPIRYPPSRQM
jgi:hypothetical protein